MGRLVIAFLASTFVLAGAAVAEDIQAGEQVFKKCRACHAVGVGARNRVGPYLNGLFGRSAGSVEGYRYSDANANSGIVWSEENFAKYIRDPRGYIPGTKMVFVGLKKDDEVVDIIAYLRQFQSDGTIAATQ